jgi:hypothetical protein
MISELNTSNANDELECLEAMEAKINELIGAVNLLIREHPRTEAQLLW